MFSAPMSDEMATERHEKEDGERHTHLFVLLRAFPWRCTTLGLIARHGLRLACSTHFLAFSTPWAAALRYHFAASASFFATPRPSSYITAKLFWATACPWSAAWRYHFAAAASSFAT